MVHSETTLDHLLAAERHLAGGEELLRVRLKVKYNCRTLCLCASIDLIEETFEFRVSIFHFSPGQELIDGKYVESFRNDASSALRASASRLPV